jgi:hypothetical protein
MSILHERIQHAVGHGGFHTSSLRVGRAVFRYVYDCGAKKPALLRRTIHDYAESIADVSRRIDLVVLSHLDDDHVSGVDDLLGTCTVETVVLPYLSAVERAFVAARSSRQDRLRATGREFIAEPGRWLREHGVIRVVFVRGGGEGGGETTGEPEQPSGDRRDLDQVRTLGIGWGALTTPQNGAASATAKSGDQFMPHTMSMPLLADGAPVLNWVLRSHVHECEPKRRAALERAARRAFRLPATADLTSAITPDVLRHAMRDPKKRDRLVASYSRIWSDRNLTSLCLYSGPNRTPTFESIGEWRSHGSYGLNALGWLGTGDAALAQAGRRRSLVRHLGPCVDNVGTLCLPHHGSRRNFHAALLTAFGHATTCVAAVPRRSIYHPARNVVRSVRANGRTLIRVAERPEDSFVDRLDLR